MKNNKNVVVKKGCHCRMSLSGIFRVLSRYAHKENTLFINNPYVEDPRLQPSGMTANWTTANSAFTLMELLIVVLIIGILAAIAIPQYQFAVDKSRITPYLTEVHNIFQAEQLYFLQNGKYTQIFDELDIDLGKICQKHNGDNELANCPSNIVITIYKYSDEKIRLYLDYCSDDSCHFANTEKQIFRLITDVQTGKVINCVHDNSARGKRLCKWLLP